MKLLNAFSYNMLNPGRAHCVEFHPISELEARMLAQDGVESAVGHQATADVFSARLGIPVPMRRVTVQLEHGDVALLGQLSGPRLPEGRILTAGEVESVPIQWVYVYVR